MDNPSLPHLEELSNWSQCQRREEADGTDQQYHKNQQEHKHGVGGGQRPGRMAIGVARQTSTDHFIS